MLIKDMTCGAEKTTHSCAYYSQGDIDAVSQNNSPNEHLFAWTVTLWGGLQKCCNRLKDEKAWKSVSCSVDRIYDWTSILQSTHMILCRPILITVWALHCIFRLYMVQLFHTDVVLCRLCDCIEHWGKRGVRHIIYHYYLERESYTGAAHKKNHKFCY